MWLRKKKDLLRLLMLVAVESIFVTNERLSRCVLRRVKTTISIIKSKIDGHIDWNGFYKQFYERDSYN